MAHIFEALIGILVFFISVVTGIVFARSKSSSSASFFSYWLIFFVTFWASLGLLFSLNLTLGLQGQIPLLIEGLGICGIWMWPWRRDLFLRRSAAVPQFWQELTVVIFLALYGLFCLVQVHGRYTGVASNLMTAEFAVSGLKYPFPYFVDEWNAIALSQWTLTHGQMPFTDPYTLPEQSFFNAQWLFHNFNSMVYQLFAGNPISGHVPLGIAVNVFLVLIGFSILRMFDISRGASLVASMLVFHLTHGSNLPTLWSYLPVHLGLVLFSIGVLSVMNTLPVLALFQWGITFLLYPPLLLFVAPFSNKDTNVLRWRWIILVSSLFVLALSLFVQRSSPDLVQSILSRLVFQKFSPQIFDNLNPLWVISPVALVFLGNRQLWLRARPLAWLLLLAILFWLIYSFTPWRFLIDFPRVVFFAGFWLTLSSGFGIQALFDWVEKKSILAKPFMMAALVVYGLVYGYFYTSLNRWQHLTSSLSEPSKTEIKPRPPATLILHADDLRAMQGLAGQYVLSDPWKSTVLATASGIKPVFLKSGTISERSPIQYQEFLQSPCQRLKPYWRLKFYAYLPESIALKCEGFTLQEGASPTAEGYLLYFHRGVK